MVASCSKGRYPQNTEQSLEAAHGLAAARTTSGSQAMPVAGRQNIGRIGDRACCRHPAGQEGCGHAVDRTDLIRGTAKVAAEKGWIAETMADDFPAFGKPYRDMSQDEWSQVRSISQGRHHALNWLCGYAPENDWDRTPIGT